MRRIDVLLSMARNMSENVSVSPTNDISDDEFLQYFNDAQDRLQSLISNTRETSKIFVTEKIIPAVASQEEYSINDRVLFNKAIEQIEFSSDSSLPNYVNLEKLSFFNRDSQTSTWPYGYYRRSANFYPVPVVSSNSGSFRVMYERSLDDLDKRRGKVSAITSLNTTTRTFASITLDTVPTPDVSSTPTNFSTVDYICLCDNDGVLKMKNIKVASYDTATRVITVDPTFVYQAGETIAANMWVVFNRYTTTHSQLPDECERYLLQYCTQAILHRDSSNDFAERSKILGEIEEEIIDSMKKQTGEVQRVPEYDPGEWY